MNQGQVKNYLAYSVGEILLVMIGILLALQVNNWNEQRKNQQNIKAHFIALKGDLELDLDILEDRNKDFIQFDASSNRMWQFIHDELTDIDTSQLKIDLLLAGSLPEYTIVTTAYDDLVGGGSGQHIQNKTLKRNIIHYYKHDMWTGLNLEQRIRYANDYFDIRMKHINPYMLSNFLKTFLNVDKSEMIPVDKFEVDWAALKADKAYELTLAKVISQRRATEHNFKTTKENIKTLLEGITMELKNYN